MGWGKLFLTLRGITNPRAKSTTITASSRKGVQIPFLTKRSQHFLEKKPNPGLGREDAKKSLEYFIIQKARN